MATNDRYDPDKEKALHEDAEAAGAGAATGLGCLAVSLLPWSIVALVFLIIFIVWIFRNHYVGG